MRVFDLFSGTGGATAAFRARGHDVVTLDIYPVLRPDILADIRALPIRGPCDLMWASPPCKGASQTSMPWLRHFGKAPPAEWWDLVYATCAAIAKLNPRWWVLENVRGAVRWIGPPRKKAGAYYLWGEFPLFDPGPVPTKNEEGLSKKTRERERARIPYCISMSLCLACEAALLGKGRH